MTRAALVLAVLLPTAAMAQTPADLARLSGAQIVVPGAVSRMSAPAYRGAVGGGSAIDIARLAPAGASQSAAPQQATSGGAFAAGDLARLENAGTATWESVADLAVLAQR